MKGFALPEFVGYIVMVVAFVSVMGTILSGPIAEWLNAREDRKKAAAEAKATAESAAGTASPSAPPSTPEPA
ncbi:MAG: hypothetical protein OXU71_10575 [Gammaproteobacteria bacterium]|nr:hypothetical protein [Gammaproteobacteria bacterium]